MYFLSSPQIEKHYHHLAQQLALIYKEETLVEGHVEPPKKVQKQIPSNDTLENYVFGLTSSCIPKKSPIEWELQAYRAEFDIPFSEDPCKWWRLHLKHYPTLAKLAVKYLSVPATSTPSERVFSTAEIINSGRRSSLKPQHVNHFIFLNKNIW